MNRMVKKIMVVLLSAFMFVGALTTPVQAKDAASGTDGWGWWGWGWWWPSQPTPEPEPSEDPVIDEEEPIVTEEPVIEEEPVAEEYPAATFEDAESSEIFNISVDAPAGAFTSDTVMNVDGITDEDAQSHMAAAVQTLDCVEIVDSRILNISFSNSEGEQEPNVPVNVTVNFTQPLAESDEYAVLHIKDDGTVEIIEDAVITADYASFTIDSFSIIEILSYTNRHSTVAVAVDGNTYITFNPSDIPGSGDITEIASGNIADNAPVFEGYTFTNATINVEGQEVEILQIGAFTAVYEQTDDQGTEDTSDDVTTTVERYNVYYRTEETMATSDIIVLIAGETITLNYEATPLTVTYRVVYNGTTYTIGEDTLPDELSELVLSGPVSVKQRVDYPEAISVSIPRGYTATLAINGSTKGSLGTEPSYSLDSANKIITKTGELTLNGTYDIDSTTANQVVTLTVTKRESFTFDASYFLSTVYTGGNGTGTMGDSTVNTNANARITGDGSLGTSGNNKGKKTFTGNEVSWSFTTNNTESSHWLLDALQINGTDINVPYGDSGPVSKTTNLPSGAVVTVTLNSVTGTGRSARRNYTISVTNVYENVVISGGNIYNADNSTEIITEVLNNVEYSFYGFSSSDNAYSSNVRPTWIDWGEGEPIAVGTGNLANSGTYDMYKFGQTNNNAMRFTVKTGYVNPEIAYVTSTEDDLHSYVTLGSGLSFGSLSDSDGSYYPVSGNPTNGYYYFRITGIGNNNKLALLRIRATLARFGISYSGGSVGDATVPDYDEGGYYGDGSLQGYNIEDNDVIVLERIVPSDPTGNYIFLNYTIAGDTSGTVYAPGQKINLTDVMQYGVYDSEKEEYVIPFVANWVEKEQAETVTITVRFILDDDFDNPHIAQVQVTKGSSVYIDIDSEEMTKFMESYNWQLFYDEMGSNPYIERADEDQTVDLHIYSKFYIYHSATRKLELHTTKEMETGTGYDRRIGTLDITKYLTEGTLYGGYYTDYNGAYVDGTNAVQASADYDNDEGTLSAVDVNTLSNKGFKVIGEDLGTEYTGQADAWTWDKAETVKGTAMQPVRAQIYYLKEVPTSYLNNYHQITYNKKSTALTGLYIISAVDDMNYTDTGMVLKNAGDNTAKVVSSLTFLNTATNRDVTLYANKVFKAKGVTSDSAKLTYINATGTEYFAEGTYTVHPYWKTPDGLHVTGTSERTITIASMTKAGISQAEVSTASEISE